jgi:hypothetical protein
MRTRFSKTLLFVVAAGACLSAASAVRAQLIFSDNFNDGNDDGWSHIDQLGSNGLGPTNYDASSGRYVISSSLALPPLPVTVGSGAVWGPAFSDPAFSNGRMRLVVRFNNTTTNAGIGGRIGADANGYLFGMNLSLGIIGIANIADHGPLLGGAPFAITPDTDYLVEAGMFGPALSLKVWNASDPEPAAPQVMVMDPTYTFGTFGPIIASQPGLAGALSATFDDITFTIPAPGTWALLGLGALATARRRR